jgi:protein-S-isoprenylcysteine O-methyltransferase Ste14
MTPDLPLTVLHWIFGLAVALLGLLLTGAVWSVAVPARRLWPPRDRRSWQYLPTWVLFYLAFALNATLLIVDWNSWVLKSNLRFIVGFPLTLLGALLVSWGIATLGARNTSGLKAGFVSTGPYRFTRNPQYVGDIILFVGLSLVANSLYLWITHILTIVVFVVAPLAEETWLEEQYAEAYTKYARGVPRFL